MLLVTFHGGSSGITNVYAYNTTSDQLNTNSALININLKDSELRGLVYANSYLYVVNGEDLKNALSNSGPIPTVAGQRSLAWGPVSDTVPGSSQRPIQVSFRLSAPVGASLALAGPASEDGCLAARA